VDGIVLGSRGRGPWYAMLGSVCRAVLTGVDLPVTVVSPAAAASPRPPGRRRIAVVLDHLLEPSPLVEVAAGLARDGCELFFVAVDEVVDAASMTARPDGQRYRAEHAAARALRCAEALGVPAGAEVVLGERQLAVREALDREDIDHVVIGRPRRGRPAAPGSLPAGFLADGPTPATLVCTDPMDAADEP